MSSIKNYDFQSNLIGKCQPPIDSISDSVIKSIDIDRLRENELEYHRELLILWFSTKCVADLYTIDGCLHCMMNTFRKKQNITMTILNDLIDIMIESVMEEKCDDLAEQVRMECYTLVAMVRVIQGKLRCRKLPCEFTNAIDHIIRYDVFFVLLNHYLKNMKWICSISKQCDSNVELLVADVIDSGILL